MEQFLLLIMGVIRCLLVAMKLCLIVRAIISWFPSISDGALGDFIYAITEPMLSVVRKVLFKVRVLRELPIDLSLLITYLLLEVVSMFLI